MRSTRPVQLGYLTLALIAASCNATGLGALSEVGDLAIPSTFDALPVGEIDLRSEEPDLSREPLGPVDSGSEGDAAAFALTITPTTDSYDTVDVGTTVSHTLSVANISTASLAALGTPTLTGDADFAISDDGCTGTVLAPRGAVGSSCSLKVEFAPSSYGDKNATLDIASNSGATASATMTGTGRATFALSVQPSNGGVLSSSDGNIDCGATCVAAYQLTTDPTTVLVNASPAPSVHLRQWGGDCSGTSTLADCSLVMNQAHFAVASFAATLDIGVATSDGSSGTISTTTPAGFSCDGANCANDYDVGTTVSLSPTPGPNSVFTGWSGDCSGAGSCSVTMDQGHTVVASFSVCPSVSPSATHYVDQSQGIDDPFHGSGSGACAYQTLQYALGHSDGSISLASGTYGTSSNDRSPFFLNGVQGIVCDPGATLSPISNGQNGIVEFDGTGNSLTGCVVDGRSKSGVSLIVSTSGGLPAHSISNNLFTHCSGISIQVRENTVNLSITGNSFPNDYDGIDFLGGNAGTIANNTFNDSFVDVVCEGNSSPGLVGSGNVRGAGAIVCHYCAGCNF